MPVSESQSNNSNHFIDEDTEVLSSYKTRKVIELDAKLHFLQQAAPLRSNEVAGSEMYP
jgi:hypothetical protein